VAGINIDGARIDAEPELAKNWDRVQSKKQGIASTGLKAIDLRGRAPQGRWPANVILDDAAGELLDQQSGTSTSTGGRAGHTGAYGGGYKSEHYEGASPGFGDTGGASRFFYCAKASRSERGEGNNHPTVKPLALLAYLCKLTMTPTGGTVLDPFCGSGSTIVAAIGVGREAIGIEKNPEYAETARARVSHARGPLFGADDE
jgi:hypothetical protein